MSKLFTRNKNPSRNIIQYVLSHKLVSQYNNFSVQPTPLSFSTPRINHCRSLIDHRHSHYSTLSANDLCPRRWSARAQAGWFQWEKLSRRDTTHYCFDESSTEQKHYCGCCSGWSFYSRTHRPCTLDMSSKYLDYGWITINTVYTKFYTSAELSFSMLKSQWVFF
jgi:hypothetical protein